MEKIIEIKINNNISFKMILKGGVANDYYKSKNLVEKYNIQSFLDLIKPGDIFFDLGTNSGLFSIPIALKEKDAKIYSFEPCKETTEILKENIKLNNLKNIFVYNLAISDYIGIGKLKINDIFKDGLNTLGKPTHLGCKVVNEEEVNVTTIDNFIKENNISTIDLMKVDVEGAELLVFKGAKDLLRRDDAPFIIFENQLQTTKGFDYDPEENNKLLKSYGYEIIKPRECVYETCFAIKNSNKNYKIIRSKNE